MDAIERGARMGRKVALAFLRYVKTGALVIMMLGAYVLVSWVRCFTPRDRKWRDLGTDAMLAVLFMGVVLVALPWTKGWLG